MNLTPPRIPRLLAVLLDRIEPESLLGDLVEEYVEIIRPERGPVRARFWFWTHLFRSVLVGTFLTRFARPAHELARDRRPRKTPGEYMTSFINDVRFGVRMIWKAPLTSVTVIVGIALGVGITTHTFSIVYGAAMRGLPYDGAERLMHIERALPSEGVSSLGVPIHDYLDWRGQQDVFEGLAAYYQQTVNLAGAEAEPERYAGAFVTWNVFEQVGPEPILGRVFRQGEDLPGAPLTIVLGYDVWQTRYGGDEDIVGKTVRANGLTATVIGVMPPNYRFPFDEDLWLPSTSTRHNSLAAKASTSK